MTGHARLRASAMLAMAFLAVGCGQASLSPTGPSPPGSVPNAATTGVEISGTVDGLTQATTSSTTFTTSANTGPVTVTVVGTNISSTIDNSGRFWLTDVPTGDVQLKFTGPGLDATLTLTGVQAGDRIAIRVRLTGSGIRIEAERRERRGRNDDDDEDVDDDDDDDDLTELEGRVSALSGTCPLVSFAVRGVTVKTTAATRYEDGVCTDVQNDADVEVKGIRQADGSMLAVRVELED